MREAIAAAMARSKREIPHYYLSQTIDLTPASDWLARRNVELPPQRRVLMGVLFIKTVALTLRSFPELNGFDRKGRFEPAAGIHVGSATAIRGGGLVAPAIHDADQLDLDTLMDRLRDLVARVRAGTLRSSELSDPTITVSSLGERGVEPALRHHLPAPGRHRRVRHPGPQALGPGRPGRPPHPGQRDPLRGPPSQRRASRGTLSGPGGPTAAGARDPMTLTETTLDRLRAAAQEELLNVAPDLAEVTIPFDADLRETLDLDSMDFVNWVAALHRRLGVDIPELDYPKLRTLDATATYLRARLEAGEITRGK